VEALTARDTVPGDRTGLTIPAHAEALLAMGPEFLTRAFHTFGSLAADNAVKRIVAAEPFAGGNSGHKLLLTLAYEQPGPVTDLFVKFSRDFADSHRDRRRYELEAEVRLALLARDPRFPVRVPRPWFGDFNHASGTGLIVTERIRFGEGGIEPLHPKGRDYLLNEPLDYYRTMISALARLVAAHQSGALSPEAEALFPFDRAGAEADLPFAYDASELAARIDGYARFAGECPSLLPEDIRTPEFIARFRHDALRLVEHQDKVRRFLYGDPAFVALAHWNTNIDNAWFFRDAAGDLHCGLLDWGMVRQMNVMLALWGGLSLAQPEMLEVHLPALMRHYGDEIAAHGGARLDSERMGLHFDLAVALVGLSMQTDIARLIPSRLPEVARAAGPRDPMILGDAVVHGFLGCFTNRLYLWQRRDFGASLARVI
jgi:hypothetical protein